MSNIAHIGKIGLGTVQFGLNYGISNRNGQTPIQDVLEIAQIASDSGLDLIDTAYSYGSSELTIGSLGHIVNGFNIVSKFPSIINENSVTDFLQLSLKRLQLKRIYGYIAHSAEPFLQDDGCWLELEELKKKDLISKIGYSLYKPSELEALLNKGMIPDLVQLPYNVFDTRFDPWLPILKRYGTEIHSRSAFLQGIFFMEPSSLPSFFDPIKDRLAEIRRTYDSEEELSGSLLHFCTANALIDKVIIGVNTPQQLRMNIHSLMNPVIKDWNGFNVTDESILIPYNWPKK